MSLLAEVNESDGAGDSSHPPHRRDLPLQRTLRPLLP